MDIEAATRRGIPVVITPGAGARAVAEGAVTFMLALCKKLSHLDAQLKAGNWRSRFDTVCGDLDVAVVGIIFSAPWALAMVLVATLASLALSLLKLPEMFVALAIDIAILVLIAQQVAAG